MFVNYSSFMLYQWHAIIGAFDIKANETVYLLLLKFINRENMTYVFIEINYTLDEEEDNSKSKLYWNLEASRFTIMYSKFI